MSDDNENAATHEQSGNSRGLAPSLPRPVTGIKPPPALVIDTHVSENWKLFKQKWNNYSVITNLSAHPDLYQVALFLHTIGDEALKVYNGLEFDSNDMDRTVEEIIEKFEDFAVGEVNETYERFVFNKREQKPEENFDSFLSSIRTLIKSCNYCHTCVDSILRDRIVLGISDATIQTDLLKERKLTLEMCIDTCRAAENANSHGRSLRPDTVNNVQFKSKRPERRRKPRAKEDDVRTRECLYCGTTHAMVKEDCPAWGKRCSSCGKRNHFAVKCPTKKASKMSKAHAVQEVEDDSSEDEWISCVSTKSSKDVKCRLLLGPEKVSYIFQIDCGASVNLLPYDP